MASRVSDLLFYFVVALSAFSLCMIGCWALTPP